jgi:CelD/BcsL family acetyltransferase involved in cellulose biosynthesis
MELLFFEGSTVGQKNPTAIFINRSKKVTDVQVVQRKEKERKKERKKENKKRKERKKREL